MLTELIELGQKMRHPGWNKAKYSGNEQGQEGNQDQSNDLEQKEEIIIQLEQNEETRIPKNGEKLRNLWDNLKCSSIGIMGVPEGEEQQQETENSFENFPNLAKEIDFQEVQEAQRVPKKWTQRGRHQGTSSLSYLRWKTRRES